MTTYGALEPTDKRTRRKFNCGGVMETKYFTYTEVFANIFLYWHQVDNNNNRRHAPISIEKTWATKYLPDSCFACYLSVSEVNAKYTRVYFQDSMPYPRLNSGEYWKTSSWNTPLVYTGTEGGSGVGLRSRIDPHKLITKPPFTGKWVSNTRQWHKVKGKYQQSRCTKFSKQTCTYCKCCKWIFLCDNCFAVHVLEGERSHTSNYWIQWYNFPIFGSFKHVINLCKNKIITPFFVSVYCKWFIDVKINFKRRKRLIFGKFIKSSKIIEFNNLGNRISDNPPPISHTDPVLLGDLRLRNIEVLILVTAI